MIHWKSVAKFCSVLRHGHPLPVYNLVSTVQITFVFQGKMNQTEVEIDRDFAVIFWSRVFQLIFSRYAVHFSSLVVEPFVYKYETFFCCR